MATQVSPTAVPAGVKLSKAIRDELPDGERSTALEKLWEKSGGVCAICSKPLPADGKNVDIDHKVARSDNGKTKLSNLYLAHRLCNRSRKNLPFDLAKRVIRFQLWCRAVVRRSFDDVVREYLATPNKRVQYSINGDDIEMKFEHQTRTAGLFTDPATDTQYFFMDVPVEYVRNDEESQPRWIEDDHVRTLAIDFSVHPVHEPSNCRLVPVKGTPDIADLLQFDGQHKTTAQIVLGRADVPMKVYVNPSEPMIQELVVQIQQGIKKRPLSTSDTLRKLDHVVQDKISAFKETHGRAPTEIELVEAEPPQDRVAFRKRLISNIEWAILDDDACLLKPFAGTSASREKPFTDKVLIRRLIKPLVSQELLDEPLDAAAQRDSERATILRILNRVAEHMLVDKWDPKKGKDPEDLQTRRARNFFYQAAIGWWLGDILVETIKFTIPKPRWKRLFLEPLTPEQEEKIDGYIDILCEWPIWSTPNAEQVVALRSNTVPNVVKAFPDYEHTRLIREYQESE
jgi:HNH endonuclease